MNYPTPILIGFKQPNYDLEYPHRYDRFRTYTIIYVYNVNKIDKELKYLVHIKIFVICPTSIHYSSNYIH